MCALRTTRTPRGRGGGSWKDLAAPPEGDTARSVFADRVGGDARRKVQERRRREPTRVADEQDGQPQVSVVPIWVTLKGW